uniref:PPM-type phosphatase domain-containing protein n=1 Tax=Heterorhabditis bacteriophora TaxID=37862 RepID=A0A1I7WD73_HETBA
MDSSWENNQNNDEFTEDFKECPNSGRMIFKCTEYSANALRVKFSTVNALYLQMMDDDLTEHCLLKDDLDKNRERISILERKLRQGSMALVLLRVDNNLYLLNCGTSLAVVVQDDQNVPVFQLNERVHEFSDEGEKIRLEGFDPEVSYLTRIFLKKSEGFEREVTSFYA